jgi:hypothetical protein
MSLEKIKPTKIMQLLHIVTNSMVLIMNLEISE